ncbi:MAG TPA: DUF721 domain-containing protein [bacterium]
MLTHLRTILRTAAKSLGVERAAYAAMAEEFWPEVVGPEAAAATRVTGLRAGTLLVDAQPGMWAQELSVRRTQLAASLNQILGAPIVQDIRIRQRAFTPPRSTTAAVVAAGDSEELSAEDRAMIEQAAAEIEDPELREITRRAMLSQARWRRRQQSNSL